MNTRIDAIVRQFAAGKRESVISTVQSVNQKLDDSSSRTKIVYEVDVSATKMESGFNISGQDTHGG